MNRANGRKPVIRPNRRLSLKDEVATRKPRRGEATCITEMSLMMTCWKQNNFVDTLCSKEVQAFYSCVHEAAVKDKSFVGKEKGWLPPTEAKTLLKRFPNVETEI